MASLLCVWRNLRRAGLVLGCAAAVQEQSGRTALPALDGGEQPRQRQRDNLCVEANTGGCRPVSQHLGSFDLMALQSSFHGHVVVSRPGKGLRAVDTATEGLHETAPAPGGATDKRLNAV